MKKLALILPMLFLFYIPLCSASTTTITTTGTYCMGDGETPDVAESRALTNAKRAAIEQAGTYVESYSQAQGFQLTKDEVNILSSGIMQVEVMDKQRAIQDHGGIYFTTKIKATITTDNLASMATRLHDRITARHFANLKNNYSTLDAEHIADLNSKESNAAAKNEKLWLANHWLDVGIQHFIQKEYPEAIDALTKSYDLNRGHDAEIILGDISYEQHQYQDAISWYKKSPESEETLLKTAIIYDEMSNSLEALWHYQKIVGALYYDDMDSGKILTIPTDAKIIDSYYLDLGTPLNSKNITAWYRMGKLYSNINDENMQKSSPYHDARYPFYENLPKAIYCFDQIIKLTPNYSPAYFEKALVYEKLNQPYEAMREYKKFMQLAGPDNSSYKTASASLHNLAAKYGI